jgi:hypothetical protein
MGKKIHIVALIAILSVALVIVVGYEVLRQGENKEGTQVTPGASVATLPEKKEPKPPFTNTPSSDIDTSNWQTYRNAEYGFELKIPQNWAINSSYKGAILFLTKDRQNLLNQIDPPIITVSDISISVSDSLTDFVKGWSGGTKFIASDLRHWLPLYETNSNHNDIVNQRAVKFNGYDAFSVEVVGEDKSSEIWIERNGKIYTLISGSFDQLANYELADQILSTFRFINEEGE